MDETKLATDTPGFHVVHGFGREASYAGGSRGVSSYGPRRIENPAKSNSSS